MRPGLLFITLAAMSGCAWQREPVPVEPGAMPDAVASAVAAGKPLTAETLDTATDADRAAALTPATGGEQRLGTAIASLGDVTEPGFWVKSPLVDAPGPGRVVIAETGAGSRVDLIPIDEGGTQMSLSAMQALGVGLTALPEVTLYTSGPPGAP